MADKTKLIAVIIASAIVALGIFAYLIRLDRKVADLEKKLSK
jgi:CcmD family protein